VLLSIIGAATTRAAADTVTSQPAAKPAPTSRSDVPRPARPGKQPEASWTAAHESFVALAKKGGIDILFDGDSITRGWNGAGVTVWQKYFADMKAANFGIGGERTQHVLWRLQNGELEGISPKVFVLMIGTNNASAGDAPEDTAQGVLAIINTVKAKCPTTKVLLLAIFPRGADANDPKRLVNNKVNELIAKFDDGGKTVKFLDINSKLMQADGTIDKTVMADSVHLTRVGFQIEAEAILPAIKELMQADK
jgi:lysophospholipase L1-like esterase